MSAPRSRMDPHWEKGRQLLQDLRFEVAQLDLLASGPVRQVARELVESHQSESGRLVLTVKPGEDDYPGRRAAQLKIAKLHDALVERTRTDLGLGLPTRPRSLLGKLLAWPNQ